MLMMWRCCRELLPEASGCSVQHPLLHKLLLASRLAIDALLLLRWLLLRLLLLLRWRQFMLCLHSCHCWLHVAGLLRRQTAG